MAIKHNQANYQDNDGFGTEFAQGGGCGRSFGNGNAQGLGYGDYYCNHDGDGSGHGDGHGERDGLGEGKGSSLFHNAGNGYVDYSGAG